MEERAGFEDGLRKRTEAADEREKLREHQRKREEERELKEFRKQLQFKVSQSVSQSVSQCPGCSGQLTFITITTSTYVRTI